MAKKGRMKRKREPVLGGGATGGGTLDINFMCNLTGTGTLTPSSSTSRLSSDEWRRRRDDDGDVRAERGATTTSPAAAGDDDGDDLEACLAELGRPYHDDGPNEPSTTAGDDYSSSTLESGTRASNTTSTLGHDSPRSKRRRRSGEGIAKISKRGRLECEKSGVKLPGTDDDSERETASSSRRRLWDPSAERVRIGTSHARNGVDHVDLEEPNLRVEMARHLYVGKMSSFLLESCGGRLRMPSFERWIIDSRLEERTKRIRRRSEEEVGGHDPKNSGDFRGEKSRRRKKKKKRGRRGDSPSEILPPPPSDCVIPSMPDVSDRASRRLVDEIVASARDDSSSPKSSSESEEDAAVRICCQLCTMAVDSARSLAAFSARIGRGGSKSCRILLETSPRDEVDDDETSGVGDGGHGGGRRNRERSSAKTTTDDRTYRLVLERKGTRPFVVRVNASHYDKLRDMFLSVHRGTSPATATSTMKTPQLLHRFHAVLFATLLRYSSLSGGQLLLDRRGGGMQGAIHGEVFDHIRRTLSRRVVECFASPLNAYVPNFCSAFPDLDGHFGSSGDFFSVPVGSLPGDCCYEANPPFSPGMMELMAERIQEHLDDADDRDIVQSFVVVVPSCDMEQCDEDEEGGDLSSVVHSAARGSFLKLLRDDHLVTHVVLRSGDHGYVEGSQHLRPTRFKGSRYDTSVFVLRSSRAIAATARSAAKAGTGDGARRCREGFEAGLRAAFACKHGEELHERRRLERGSVGKRSSSRTEDKS